MTRLFIAMLVVPWFRFCRLHVDQQPLYAERAGAAPAPAPAESAAPPTSQGAPAAGPRGPMTPAASAAAAGGAAPGELLECVTQSCKINCSQKVKPQFRPKWCGNFKSPD